MANNPPHEFHQIRETAEKVSQEFQADVIVFNSSIDETSAEQFHETLESIKSKHKKVFLILVTYGGDAHAAYVIARDLQLRYEEVIICIAGDCYSAGTLIVLSAHKLIITDRGRLGPLDVQLLKQDELGERLSGLTLSLALDELQKKAFTSFLRFAINMKENLGAVVSFRTAMEMATNMTASMYGEVFKQIDPVRLATDAMALKVASHYGEILGKTSGNLKPRAVQRLLDQYPSHACIIDRKEASEELFKNVIEAKGDTIELLKRLGAFATDANTESKGIILHLSSVENHGESNAKQKPTGNTGIKTAKKGGDVESTVGGLPASRNGTPTRESGKEKKKSATSD